MSTDALSNSAAEWSIVATLVTDPTLVAEVVGSQLEAGDFIRVDAQVLYATTVEAYFADQPVEPLTIAEKVRKVLAREWEVKESAVSEALLTRLGQRDLSSKVIEHAAIVKRLSTARKLHSVANRAINSIEEGERTPEEVAGNMSSEALAVASGTAQRSELLDWMGTGREYVRYLQRQRLARAQGIEMAVYTGLPFVDQYTKGLAPTELGFLGGAPGVGKSIVGWKCAEGFALRQMTKPPDHRVGTLVLSLEMGLVPSSTRLAQSITGIDGMRLREGEINDQEYRLLLREWKARSDLPMYFNYASNFRLSQLRALIVEGIRKYNVGFVVLDHFRQIDPDKPIQNPNEADEVKVRWLKEAICKDLNVAVLCLAHTLKLGRASEGPGVRPRLSDLRGSGQIAANADFVGLLYRPSRNLTEEEQLDLHVNENDCEILWVKARHTNEGVGYFSLDAANMTVTPR